MSPAGIIKNGGSVFIRQYQDRVVESPGGFPNGITIENILDRQSPRNRRIAEILALCGLGWALWYRGMNLMYEWSIKEAKQLPDFTGTDQDFVKINSKRYGAGRKMLSLINRIGDERMESLTTGDFW